MNEELKIIISAEIDRLKKDLLEAQKQIQKTGDEAKKASKDTDSFTDVFKKQSKELQELKTKYIDIVAEYGEQSEQAQECAKEIENLSSELRDNKKAIEDAANAADKYDKTLEETKNGAKEWGDGITAAGDMCKKGLAVAGGAILGAGAALVGIAKSTEEYRAEQAKLVTAFETAGSSAETAKNTYNDLYRVLGDGGQATEAANHLAKLTTEEKALNEWTTICQGVYATFGDSLPIEGLTEAANETAKVGQVTGSLADALNWAGISEDEFNEKLAACNTEAEREKLIRDTLNGTYQEAAANYEKNAEDILAQNEAQAKLDETMAKIGETLQPVLTAFAEMAATIAEQVSPAIQSFMDEHGDKLTETLTDIAEAIGKVIGWIADNWDVIAPIAGVVLAIAAALAILSTGIGIYNAAMAIANTVSLPIIAIIVAIGAAIAVLIIYWDDIKEAVRKAVDFIKEKINQMVEKFQQMKDNVANKVEQLRTKITNTFNKVKDAITKPVEKARDAVKKVIDKIKGFFNFTWSLPKLKTPKFSITPQGWKIGDLLEGVIPKLGVTWNARGGVFDKPTLFGYGNSLQGIGEAGAEAVVPLENNLEWLDKLASMLNERIGGGAPIYLMVDKRVLGQVSAEGINDITKQTGSIPLVIA